MSVSTKLLMTVIISVVVAFFAWENFYFSLGEGGVLGVSLCISLPFLLRWYRKTTRVTAFFKQPLLRLFFYLLPTIPVLLYWITLRTIASWDVVDEFWYIVMYLILGIAWLAFSLQGMLLVWSFSYEDDALMGSNHAAIVAMTGAIIGSSLIYTGANIGDGPGWWSVIFAGLLGMVSWLLLGGLIDKLTGQIESVIMAHDLNSGIRFAAYLVASALILARASSGDWTSFDVTLVEFLAGWPVVLLVIGVIILERTSVKTVAESDESKQRSTSILIGMAYLLYGLLVTFVLMPILGGGQ